MLDIKIKTNTKDLYQDFLENRIYVYIYLSSVSVLGVEKRFQSV